MKCDHIVGHWSQCDESGLVYVSDWKFYVDEVERWPFCPLCGKSTTKLKAPRKYRYRGKHDEVTEAFIKETERIGPELMKMLLAKRKPV